jgi:alkaline phosphatase
MKKTITTLCIALTLSACNSTENTVSNTVSNTASKVSNIFPSTSSVPNKGTRVLPKNIIMVVGDGMGPAYTSAYRYFNDDPTTPAIESTIFDNTLVGMSSTYPARVSGYVTDSAASATALATGVKSYNGAIGVDENKKPVQTVLEWAKLQGKKTGIVVTSQINHATPASYLAHNESRRNYNAIADSYIDDGIKADVILGGGWQYFIREDRNLVNEFTAAGFHYIDNYLALDSLPKNKPVLGLFADVGLPWALDDTNESRLSSMTKAAVGQLENPHGFFMLVEASQIDWAGHSNDIAAAMAEMTDLAKTIEYLASYVDKNPETLVILTADHSTGGFTIAANGVYEWNPDILRTMKHSPLHIAKKFAETDITPEEANQLLNFRLTKDELIQLQQAKYVASEKLATFYAASKVDQESMSEPNITNTLYKEIKKVIDKRTNTGWTSGGHTAIDVPVFAFGHGSELFKGKLDNTDIAKLIFTLQGKVNSQQ